MDQNLLKQMLGRRRAPDSGRDRAGGGDRRLDAVMTAVRELQQQLAGLGAAPTPRRTSHSSPVRAGRIAR